jgi:hypothetical protein
MMLDEREELVFPGAIQSWGEGQAVPFRLKNVLVSRRHDEIADPHLGDEDLLQEMGCS